MKLYLTISLIIIGYTLHAQNKGVIGGTVLDSEQKALEKATVSVLNKQDSTVIAYTLADDKGKFKLYKLPLNQSLTLIISHVSTAPYNKEFILTSEKEHDLDTIIMGEKMLDEVLITVQPPVRLNNDTLEYNANYFKTRPNASVEELMKKLPGLQVNLDGSIYYQGKEVSKVLVNNKEFFAQDLRIATRNLDASMVDVVQVYRDRGDSKQVVEDETTLPITINLKFKKELARADFGKFYGSGGTQDRYESGILLNTFRDTLQVSFIGYGNNINRQSFDYSELSQHGGLQRAENYGFSDFGGRNYSGIQNDVSGGVNVNYDWGKITKLNVMYRYTYGDQLSENKGESEEFFDIGAQYNKYGGSSINKTHKNILSGSFKHKFDTTLFLRFTPRLAFDKSKGENNSTTVKKNATESIYDITDLSNNNNKSLSYSHGFYVEKSFNPKVILSLNNSLNISSGNINRIKDQLSTIYEESVDPNKRLINLGNITSDFSGKISSNLQLKIHKKFTVDVFANYDYLRNKRNEELALAINGGDLTERNDSENSLYFTTREYAAGTKLIWTVIKDLTLQASLTSNYKHNTFDYLDVLPTRQSKDLYWLPTANIRYKSYSLNYTRGISYPSLYSIRAVDNTMEAMGVAKAFPYAENTVSDVINFNMFKNFNNYKNQLHVYVNYSNNSYSLGSKSNQDLKTGRYETDFYIAPGATNLSTGVTYSQPIKLSEKWNLRINERFNSYLYNNYRIINDIENKGTMWSNSIVQEFTFSWKEIIAFSPKYTFGYNKNFVSTTDPNFRNSVTTSHGFTAGLNVNNVKKLSLETSYSLRVQKGGFKSNPVTNIINMSLYYDLQAKGQIKLSVFDLLNQNISIYNSSFHNSNYYYESATLKQYFLLGYVYKFNKAKMR